MMIRPISRKKTVPCLCLHFRCYVWRISLLWLRAKKRKEKKNDHTGPHWVHFLEICCKIRSRILYYCIKTRGETTLDQPRVFFLGIGLGLIHIKLLKWSFGPSFQMKWGRPSSSRTNSSSGHRQEGLQLQPGPDSWAILKNTDGPIVLHNDDLIFFKHLSLP